MPSLQQVNESIMVRENALLRAAGAQDVAETILGSVSVSLPRGGGPVTITRMTQHTITREQWDEVCNAQLN